MDTGFKLLFAGVPFALAIIAAFRYVIAARLLEDIPTSKARSAEQGYVELEGHAELLDGPPITAPLSGRECVWWSYTVERRSGKEWTKVRSGTSESVFAIRDATGQCLVDPEGARVYPEHVRRWTGKAAAKLAGIIEIQADHRYREYYLMPHELICVIGYFRTHTAIDHWDDQEELRALLAEWKRNQPRLLERFDTDNNGVVDQDEWEVARATAVEELRKEKLEHAVKPGVHVIGAPADGRPFLIAPLRNSDFAASLRRKALWSLLGAIAAGSVLMYLLLAS
ncbi:MAG: hypothetical protein HKN70_05815 [Gammaproteobacteria bacterium]|nr:hypothetical protein [Gammaproteobacteria bacterium]